MLNRLKKWYQGKWVPGDNDPDSSVVFLGHMERPLIARTLTIARVFWLKHWQFILMFLLSLGALLAAITTCGN